MVCKYFGLVLIPKYKERRVCFIKPYEQNKIDFISNNFWISPKLAKLQRHDDA
jgi:hypothetical protein